MDESTSFRRIADHIPQWTVTTYDRRGWGAAADLGPAPLEAHIADLAQLLAEGEPCVLAGHSAGATVALAVAVELPSRVRAVVAYEPPLPWLPWWPERAPWERLVLDEGRSPADAAEALMREVLGDDGWTRLPERVRTRRRAEGPALLEEMRSLADAFDGFDPFEIPDFVLAAAGFESLPHHRLVAEKLSELVPQGAYIELAGTGHAAHVTHAEAFAGLVETAASSAGGNGVYQ
jgi:pimeloyl-ACP methyl ester carboxylesterase